MAFAGTLYFESEDEALMANDDEPIDKAKAAAYRAMMKRAGTETAANGVRMKIDAEKRRQIATHLATAGDRIDNSFELAEACRLDEEANLVLTSSAHATGPAIIGMGGEIAHGSNQFADTVRTSAGMIVVDASEKTTGVGGEGGCRHARPRHRIYDPYPKQFGGDPGRQTDCSPQLAMTTMARAARSTECFENSSHVAVEPSPFATPVRSCWRLETPTTPPD